MTTEREDRIRQRAHQLWEEQGRPEGRHHEHWSQASSEIGEDGDANGTTAGPDGTGGNSDIPPAPRLQEDPPEGDRDTIESELARRQYDELENGTRQG